jgi:hypothetical protein
MAQRNWIFAPAINEVPVDPRQCTMAWRQAVVIWVGFLFSRNAASVVVLFENFRKRSVLVVLFAIFSTGSRAFFLSGSRGTSIGSIEKQRFGETSDVFFLDRAGPFSNLPS